jgi:enterochelin esterase family protein
VETKPEWQPHPDAVAKDDVSVEQKPWESKILQHRSRLTIWENAVNKFSSFKAGADDLRKTHACDANVKERPGVGACAPDARGRCADDCRPLINPAPSSEKRQPASNRGAWESVPSEEIIPEVESWSHPPDPTCERSVDRAQRDAFTVARERPDQFRKVYSSVGSFTTAAVPIR